jgi:hypothetical protein
MRYLLFFLTFNAVNAFGQTDETGVKKAVEDLFSGMRTNDTALIRSAFSQHAILQTIVRNKEGKAVVISEAVDSFLISISHPHKEIYDERISYDAIRIDGDLAMVWAPYKFYVGEKFSHCGVDSFQLIKENGMWKILYLVDTRRKQPCE